MKRFLTAFLVAFSMAAYAVAGVPATKVHKPTGDKIQVESGGEIELKSGSTLDVQSGTTVNMQGTITPPSGGWPIPTVDITVTTPTATGLLVKTAAFVVYLSTNITGVNGWQKVGTQ